ncbi:MAG: amidohydrolase family protein [Terracidiphilus sp.]|nr:amidohydrolase family protein [Terracidiphilus sp.]
MIDSHCHVFNGTDLQVAQFIKLNASLIFDQTLKDLAGDLLQDLTWALAPTGCEEYRELGELARCSNATQVSQRVEAHRENAFRNAQSALKKTAAYRQYNTSEANSRRRAAIPATDKRTRYLDTLGTLLDAKGIADYRQRVQALHQPINARKSAVSPDTQLSNLYVAGLFKFILQGFSYRFVSVQDYLKTYYPAAGGTGSSVDLMVANLVDYDWPLAEGCSTRTSLRDQLDVMERISVFTRGQVHAMVPFDPMRQVARKAGIKPDAAAHCHYSGTASDLSFSEITAAVESRGFLGIKLYLPMGFLPTGNGGVTPETWDQLWLPKWMKLPVYYPSDKLTKRFGERMDEELDSLYHWACANQVPITAHAEASQGPSMAFDLDAVSTQWAQVLAKYPDLRINFGHTGDISSNETAVGCALPADSQTLIGLFGTGKGVAGDFAYGDLSYAEGVLTNQQELQCRLLSLFEKPTQKDKPNAYDRLMYGTDWLMLLQEPHVENYQSDFESLMTEIDLACKQTPPISQRFFGLNAARWLGLARGEATRTRLDDFYKHNAIDEPRWMAKV